MNGCDTLGAVGRARDLRRRRYVVLGISVMILLGMSPIFAHHIGFGIDRLLFADDHWGRLCLIALHMLLEPIHQGFHWLFLAGVMLAASDRIWATWTARETIRAVEFVQPEEDGKLREAARCAGIDMSLLRLGRGLPVPAFTSGWIRPRIYLAKSLEELLSQGELVAVLAHEGAHASARDPLRLSTLRFLSLTLFWLPALRQLASDFADEAEIRADDAASAAGESNVASALVKLADWPALPIRGHGQTAFHQPDLLSRRVRRLLGEDVLPNSNLSRRFMAAAVPMLLLVWITGVAVAHPLPEPDAAHCEHSDRKAWHHLWCTQQLESPVRHCTQF